MMDFEYFLIILLAYILYPYILINLCYILINKASKADIKIILNFFILPIGIYIGSIGTNISGLFLSIILFVSKYTFWFYIVTYVVVLIRFIINKIKNKNE